MPMMPPQGINPMAQQPMTGGQAPAMGAPGPPQGGMPPPQDIPPNV